MVLDKFMVSEFLSLIKKGEFQYKKKVEPIINEWAMKKNNKTFNKKRAMLQLLMLANAEKRKYMKQYGIKNIPISKATQLEISKILFNQINKMATLKAKKLKRLTERKVFYIVRIEIGKGKRKSISQSIPLPTKMRVNTYIRKHPLVKSNTTIKVTNTRTKKTIIDKPARFYRLNF